MQKADARRLVTELEDSVMCEGFDGYLFNSDEDPSAALAALEVIGAAKTAEIVRRAYSRFPGGVPPRDRFVRQTVLERLNPDGDAFHEDDNDFFAYPEDLQQLIEAYEVGADRRPLD